MTYLLTFAYATTSVMGMTTLLALAIALSPINLADLPAIDTMPVCQLEDGSDSAVLPCLWVDPDTDSVYVTYADHSDLLIDDTAR